MTQGVTYRKAVILLTISMLIASFFVFSSINDVRAVDEQEFDYAISYGGPGVGFNVAEPFNLITDGNGNIYLAGYFQDVIDFDPGAGSSQLTATSTSDLYVQKLDPDGNLLWVKQLAGSTSGSFINSVGLDSNGNFFGAGYFRGTIDFDPGAGSFPLTALGTNNNDTFVFKLDSNGNFVWATQHAGVLQDQAEKIIIGPDDNVYVAGYFRDTVDFDPGVGVYNISAVGTNNRDGYVFKLDNNGNFVWAYAYQSTTDVADQVADMEIDAAGNLYIVGNFSGTLDFDFGAGTQELIGSSFDLFIHEIDANGNFISVKAIFGSSNVNPQFIEVDSSGNIFTSGSYSGTVDFDPGAGTFNLTGTSVRFIHKIDSSGNFDWVASFGDSTAPRWTALKSDSDGAIYGYGRITASRDMDPGAGTVTVDPTNGRDFLLKLDATGAYVWVKQFTGGATNAIADELYIDAADNIFVSGDFDGTGDFDPGAGTYNITDTNTTGPYDAFMVKLAVPAPPATAPTVTTSAATAIGETSATLNGEITDIGSQSPTERGFEYGLDNTYGTTASDIGTFSTGVFSEDITGLTCNTLYYFRAFAISPDGTGNGAEQTFTTSACPAAGGSTSSGSVTREDPVPLPPLIQPFIPLIPVIPPLVTTPPAPAPITNPTTNNDSSPEPDSGTEPSTTPESSTEDTSAGAVVPPGSDQEQTSSRDVPRDFDFPVTQILDQVSGWISSINGNVLLLPISSAGLLMLFTLLPIASIPWWLFLAAAGPLGLTGWRLVYQRYLQDLFSFLGLRKKRRVWGTVYDSQTKQPLDPAVVELIDADTGVVKERAITDLAGRFGFIATAGKYILKASKTHYAFPSQTETGTSDEIFGNLYHGEKLSLTEDSTLVTPNIPMDPTARDWNQEAKQRLLPSRLRRAYFIQLVFNTIFVVGFAFAIYNFFTYHNTWNTVVFIGYFVIIALRILLRPKHLWGTISRAGRPLPNVRLELTHPKFQVVMGKALSAIDGKFFLKTPERGEYVLQVKDRGTGAVIHQSVVMVGKDCVLNQDLNLL